MGKLAELLPQLDILLEDALTSPPANALRRAGNEIREEIRVARERDPAATSDAEVLLLYSGVHAILAHKVSHKLYKKRHFFSARAVSQAARLVTGIEIHPGATIGKGFFIDHGASVVIGETTEIGDNCTIYQGVTLGGTGKDTGKRHPTLGNNVMVGAGAKVLGPFKIGDNAKIAANAVVLEEIPADSTAVGIPARVVRLKNKKINGDANRNLDHVHIPDPVAEELNRLQMQIARLEKEMDCLKSESVLCSGAGQTTAGAETKPAEIKPAETKPAETKPAETKPAEIKPAATERPETAQDTAQDTAKETDK